MEYHLQPCIATIKHVIYAHLARVAALWAQLGNGGTLKVATTFLSNSSDFFHWTLFADTFRIYSCHIAVHPRMHTRHASQFDIQSQMSRRVVYIVTCPQFSSIHPYHV